VNSVRNKAWQLATNCHYFPFFATIFKIKSILQNIAEFFLFDLDKLGFMY
jgi:hypothetical protein